MSEQMRVRPFDSPRWGLGELAALVGSTASAEVVVTGLALNTAALVPGDLYAALPGAGRRSVLRRRGPERWRSRRC
ncbi:hypothetical protein [Aeromicrobium sp. UC242_57]|uniref:hypothetical protein n=1 Tax=Aeromicrobium sp. UC242_57 TaxID=3374624 RepID=UPI00378FA10D